MLEKPDLPDECIYQCLLNGWRLDIASLDFMPIGNDATAWSYRVTAGGQAFFLKVRRLPLNEAALDVPSELVKQGIEAVVAPLPDENGSLWRSSGDFGLCVYPFIAGPTGMESGLTQEQWIKFGRFLRDLHEARISQDLFGRIPRETYQPRWAGMVRRIEDWIESSDFQDSLRSEAAAFWRGHNAEIRSLRARCEELGRLLGEHRGEQVLCHADIHTANLLVDENGDIHIVDWDQPVIAPRERDLMFVMGDGPADQRSLNEQFFFDGYGPMQINPYGLAYYRYEWCVQELGDYGERIFFQPRLGEETIIDSLRGLQALFQPGDVIDEALRSERWL